MNPQVEHFLRCVAHRQFEPMPDENRGRREPNAGTDRPSLGSSASARCREPSRLPAPEPDYVEGHRVYEVRR